MANKIQVRRGVAAGRPTFDQGEPGLDTDAVRIWVGTGEGNRELQMKGSTTDYTIYVATSALGGVPSASGATGKPLLTGTADSGTSGTTLYDAAGTFTSAAHLNKAIYNATTDVWSKVASVPSSTNLTLSVSGSFAAGDTYVITNAFDNIPEAFNVADAGYNANITLRVSAGTFSNVLTLIGKTAGAAKTLTIQGSTTGTTTVSGETFIYQKISLKNITFTKRIFEYFGADVDWTTCVTSGDDGFLLLKSTSVANTFRTSSVIVFENDPAVYTSISSTVTKGYTIYVATSTYGGDDAVGDGLKITQGTATATTANKLVDSTANFNSTDHLYKTIYNSTDDTWAKISAIDSTTQVSISADIMASGEAYVIANAVSTIQRGVDLIPGNINANTVVKVCNGTFREAVEVKGKALAGTYYVRVTGTLSMLTSGTATSGASRVLNDTGKAWTVNAYIGKRLKITGGTGSGQEKLIKSNTATQCTIVGDWNTTPDATSTYQIHDRLTIISGADAGTPTTPLRHYCVSLASPSMEVHDLITEYAVSNGVRMWFTAAFSRARNVEIRNCSSVGFSIRATVGIGRLIYANNNGGIGIGAQHAAIAYLINCFVNNTTLVGLRVDAVSGVAFPSSTPDDELSGGVLFQNNGSHGIHVFSVSQINTGLAGSWIESLNNGGWGALATDGGIMYAASTYTYSGNVSGTYSPTTALAGGVT